MFLKFNSHFICPTLKVIHVECIYEIDHQVTTTNSQVYVEMARIYFNKQAEPVTDTRNKSFDGAFVAPRKVIVHRQRHLRCFISSKQICNIVQLVLFLIVFALSTQIALQPAPRF